MRVPLALAAVLAAALAASAGCSSPPAPAPDPADALPQGPALVRVMAVQPTGKRTLNESVTVSNLGTGAARLTGWTLHDWDDNVYPFPDGFVLLPDSSVTIHTGKGQDTPGHLHWGLAKPIWDDEDQAVVRDANGTVRHYLHYGGKGK